MVFEIFHENTSYFSAIQVLWLTSESQEEFYFHCTPNIELQKRIGHYQSTKEDSNHLKIFRSLFGGKRTWDHVNSINMRRKTSPVRFHLKRSSHWPFLIIKMMVARNSPQFTSLENECLRSPLKNRIKITIAKGVIIVIRSLEIFKENSVSFFTSLSSLSGW